MVYVFGMGGVPLFEMLFIFTILMLIGLIFVLLEIKKLVSLIAEEKVDIKRFEMDLGQFERGKGKNPPNELVNYVKSAQDRGISNSQIKTSLDSVGWKQHDVKNIFQQIRKKF